MARPKHTAPQAEMPRALEGLFPCVHCGGLVLANPDPAPDAARWLTPLLGDVHECGAWCVLLAPAPNP